MRTIVLGFIILASISQAACKKEVVEKPPPPPPDTPKYHSKMDIRWLEFLTPDSAGAYYLDPYFWNDYVMFCTRSMLNKGELTIAAFQKQSGARHPLWNNQSKNLILGYIDYIPDWKLTGSTSSVALLGVKNRLYAWDLSTGTMKYSVNHAPLYGLAEFSVLYGTPYHSCTNGNDSQTRLFSIDPETGTTEAIVTLNAASNEGLSILPPSAWISPARDTVLVFMTQGFRDITQGFVNAYAYDINNKKFLWNIELTPPNGLTVMTAPLVIRNRVVFITASGLHCVDIPTGTITWEHKFPNPLKGFNYKPLYADGRIYQRSGEEVMALDAYTGTILWAYKDKINNLEGGSMAYYKGNLYFTAEDGYDPYYARYLFCLEGATGKLIWKDKGPHEYSGMAFGVIVDPATGYLYATDAFRMMCIDLNNTPKKP